MSYEGFEQCICTDGHRFDHPCTYGNDDYVCHCGKLAAWMNAVDQTNNAGDGIIPDEAFEQLLLTPEVVVTCVTCQHAAVTQEATYRAPTQEELRAMRRCLVQISDTSSPRGWRWDYVPYYHSFGFETTILPVPLPGYGGLEQIAYLQAKGLARCGHEVTLVATSIMCEHIGLGQASEAGFGPAHV